LSSRVNRRAPPSATPSYGSARLNTGSLAGLPGRASGRRSLLILPPLAISLALGLWGVNFGLPFLFRPDEDVMVGRAVRMAAEGSLDPLFANYPPLAFDLFALAERAGATLGLVSLAGAAGPDPSSEYLAARLVSVLSFVLTTVLVGLAAQRAYSGLAGPAAALLFSVAPLAVRQAHFATTDFVQVAFLAGALWTALRAAGWRGFAAAGALAGLAAASKYTGGAAILPVAVLALLAPGRWRCLGAAAAAAAIAFALPGWVVLLHPGDYAGGVGFLFSRGYLHPPVLGAEPPIGIVFHPTVTLPFGLGLGAYALALAGLAVAVWRRTPADLALASYVFVYLAVTGAGHDVLFRYALPLLPALAVLAGGAARLRPGLKPATAAGLLGLLALPGLYASVETDRLLATADTRQLAAQWIQDNVPEGAEIQVAYYAQPFFDQREVEANLKLSGSRLAAGFLQGRYTSRYLVSENGGQVVVAASGPPDQGPAPAGPGLVIKAYHGRWSASVYDPLDAFYLPIWGFEGIDRPGPSLLIQTPS